MEDEQIRLAKLERSRRPVAMVHVGMYTYANPAFLQLLGYERFEELEGIPVLDMVAERYRERLRDHLSEVAANKSLSPHRQKTKLTLIKRDGGQLVIVASFRRSHLSGEETVELTLLTRKDVTVRRIFLGLPWRLYTSLFVLLLLMVVPGALLLKLNINNAPKVYLPPDAPSVLVDDKLREFFPSDQALLLLFEGVAAAEAANNAVNGPTMVPCRVTQASRAEPRGLMRRMILTSDSFSISSACLS